MKLVKMPVSQFVEYEEIKHNGIYSVHCVRIAWRKHSGFRFPLSFWWKDSVASFFVHNAFHVSVSLIVTSWYWMCGIIQIVLNSTQKVDNVILNQERYVAFGYTLRIGVIKTTGNIRIYCLWVLCVRSRTNQSYYLEYDWECLSPSSKWR